MPLVKLNLEETDLNEFVNKECDKFALHFSFKRPDGTSIDKPVIEVKEGVFKGLIVCIEDIRLIPNEVEKYYNKGEEEIDELTFSFDYSILGNTGTESNEDEFNKYIEENGIADLDELAKHVLLYQLICFTYFSENPTDIFDFSTTGEGTKEE